jgi:hypothetical protein
MPLVAVLGVCLGGPLASATEPPAPLLDLVWIDLTGLSPAVVGLARAEVGDLLAPLGVRVVSRLESPGVGFPPGQAIVILRRSDPNPAHTGRSVGGAVTEAPETSRTLWVFPACVADGLGLTLEHQPLWSSGQRREFARALAVVVIHELQHLAGAHHSSGGLMSRSICPSQLRDRHLQFDARLAPRLQAALAARTHREP